MFTLVIARQSTVVKQTIGKETKVDPTFSTAFLNLAFLKTYYTAADKPA